MIKYEPISKIIEATGLRLVLVEGYPSPWGHAVKAMMEYKNLIYRTGAQKAGEDNPELIKWAGVNSGPVVAWDLGPPLNRWNDILFLLERLNPEKNLIPDDGTLRVQCMGFSHEICGELGLGWNRRLSMFRPIVESSEMPDGFMNMADKWGYNQFDVEMAEERSVTILKTLAEQLKLQKTRGSKYFLGNSVTAVDFYWAAFSNLCELMPPSRCPVSPERRPLFENVSNIIKNELDPCLMEHRDRIMDEYFVVPMDL